MGYALAENEIGIWPNLANQGATTISSLCPGCDIDGYNEADDNPHTGAMSHGDFDREILGSTAKFTIENDAFTFTSISHYQSLDKILITDPDGSPNPFFEWTTEQSSKDISQEVRFDGDVDNARWQVGAYYLNMDSEYVSQVDLDLSRYAGLPGIGQFIGRTRTEWDLDVRSWALFGHLEYQLSEEFSTTFGLRYTRDDKEVDAVFDDVGLLGVRTPYNAEVDPNAKRSFSNMSLTSMINWRPNDNWMYYLSFNRGHKGGNWAMPVFGLARDPDLRAAQNFPDLPHDEEVLHAYELGSKGDFWDGKARLNASIYYYDYQDYQVFSLRNAVQTLSNRDAKISGGELELTLNPASGLDVIFGVSSIWENTVENVPLPTGSADRDLPMSPMYTLNLLTRYSWQALDGEMSAQIDVNWSDEFFFYAANEPITHHDSYAVANARLSYTDAKDHWQLALWVKNLLDEEYDVFRLDVGVLGFCGCASAPPRSGGATLSYRW